MSAFLQQNPPLASDLLNALNLAKDAIPEEERDNIPFWREILKFNFPNNGKDIRSSKNPSIVAFWNTINVKINNYAGPLKFSTGKNNEICLGKIGLPENSEAFDKLREVNPDAKPRMNLNKVTFNCNKYKDKNNTNDTSILYQLVELIFQIFEREISFYIQNGLLYIDYLKKAKTANKNITALDAIKAYDVENSTIRLGGQILLTDDFKLALKKSFPDAKDIATIIDKLFIIPYNKPSSSIQSIVPENAKTNGGSLLANPYVRCLIEFNTMTGLSKTSILDFEKGRVAKVNVPVTVNGNPITVNNIHEAIPYGTEFRGIINMSEICFSKVAISLPVKIDEIMIIKSNLITTSAVKSSLYDSDDEIAEAKPLEKATKTTEAIGTTETDNNDSEGDDLLF